MFSNDSKMLGAKVNIIWDIKNLIK